MADNWLTQPIGAQYHTQATQTVRRNSHGPAWLGLFGAVLILTGLIAPNVSGLFFKANLETVKNVCNSPLGALVSGNSTIAHNCSTANTISTVLTVALIAGIGLVVAAIVASVTRRSHPDVS
jgi:hypothetical protein